MLGHAVQQRSHSKVIGDMLEDDVECIHQIAAKIESRGVTRIKNKNNTQALACSKIKAVQNNHNLKGKNKRIKIIKSKETLK
jgi:hypothetical protein